MIEGFLSVSLEHLHRQRDLAVASFQEASVDRQFNAMCGFVDVGFTQENGVNNGELSATERIPLFDGMNRVAVYVRDADGMTSSRSAYIFKK